MKNGTWLACAVILLVASGPGELGRAHADPQTSALGHKPTAWARKGFARREAFALADRYRAFIDRHRSEREVVAAALTEARRRGFRDLTRDKAKIQPGHKLYMARHGKIAALVVVGKRPLGAGVHVVATHVDAVRIDLKQTPLYTDGNLAFLETHYYGGIKRYQWLSEPLQLRGVVIRKDGKRVDVAIGDDADEPVLVIPDIAAHMASYVDSKEGEDVEGEGLDPVVSSTPSTSASAGDPFAREAQRLIESELGIEMSELATAELELVPANPVRDVGLDRALVGGYGQDDRACTFAALEALWQVGQPEHTALVVLLDKEEIGSTGNTGAESNFVRQVLAELLEASGTVATEAELSRVLTASMVMSADATGAVNPAYAELYDKKNAAYLGSGVVWDQSAAHAEVLAYVRGLFSRAGVQHQAANWGKARGSRSEEGTVLPFFTRLGMDGLDVSIPLLSMHSPFELISKADLYEAQRAYQAFLAD